MLNNLTLVHLLLVYKVSIHLQYLVNMFVLYQIMFNYVDCGEHVYTFMNMSLYAVFF